MVLWGCFLGSWARRLPRARCTRRGPGCAVVARFNGLDMGGWGELHYMGVRHAGDTLLEGFV